MTDKEIRRKETNEQICQELKTAMDREPGLNVRAVLDRAVTFFDQDSSCHNKTNEEMLGYLQRYNRLRDRDKINQMVKGFVYEG